MLGKFIRAVTRGGKNISGKAFRGLKSAGESVKKGFKAGVEQIKKGVSKLKDAFTKSKAKEPKLSDTLRGRGAFKPQGKAKIPYEPPVKYKRTRKLIDKGKALNDPII